MLGRMLLASIAGLLLVGCESPQVRACEEQLLGKLKSPSSYKRIKAQRVTFEAENPPYQSVLIEYDAENSYGALLRDKELCNYRIENGHVTLEQFDPYAEEDSDLTEAADNALDAAGNAIENARTAVENASEAVANAAENAAD